MTIEAAVAATGGALLQGGGRRIDGVSIDSRQVAPGQAFVAIAGERFDGHAYLDQAAQRGAELLVVERAPAPLPAGPAVLQVEGSRTALGRLARAWKREVAPRSVAITGSVGKTTTKELTRTLLATLGSTHWNPGNFNNDIGLPLTLLQMPAGTEYLVAEMGMNAPGEIAYLTDLLEPDVGLITCVAPVHLEGLGSIEAVARAKGELLQGLPPDAWAVVPGDEPLLAGALAAVAPERRVRFGEDEEHEVCILEVQGRGRSGIGLRLSLRGEIVAVELPLVGAYNARNAAAAAAAALVLGLEPGRIGAALAAVERLHHRASVEQIGEWHVLDDCYNANPVATRAALDTLVELAGRAGAVAVLGDMLELGPQAGRDHDEVGRHAAAVGLQLLVTVGTLGAAVARGALEAGMDSSRVVQLSAAEEAAAEVARVARPGSWVLVKASRGARLERVIEGLRTIAGRPAHQPGGGRS